MACRDLSGLWESIVACLADCNLKTIFVELNAVNRESLYLKRGGAHRHREGRVADIAEVVACNVVACPGDGYCSKTGSGWNEEDKAL